LLERFLNGSAKEPNFDNARRRAQNRKEIENTAVAPLKPALLKRWLNGSERCFSGSVDRAAFHTIAKPKFITAMDHCFNARHCSSNSVSARKTLTTASPKFVQR